VDISAIFSGLSFTVSVLICSLLLYLKPNKKAVIALIATASLSGIIFFFSTIVFIHKAYVENNVTEAVIMTEEARAYSGPGTENTLIFTIHEGTKVVIERSNDNWNLVRLKSGAGGWIISDSMNKI